MPEFSTRRWIWQEKQRQAELAARQAPPPPPYWVVQLGIGVGRPPLVVHVGGCRLAGGRRRAIDRDQALRALADGIEPCQVCRPDRELGCLDSRTVTAAAAGFARPLARTARISHSRRA